MRRLIPALAVLLVVTLSGTPAHAAPGKKAEQLDVMSYNMWFGGTRVNDYRAKQLRFLRGSGADIVGIQEQYNSSGKELAKALGWHVADGGYDLAIISRHPITKVTPPTSKVPAINARIKIEATGQEVSVWNAHLGYNPYGPYDMCFGKMTEQKLLQREEQSGRTPQIKAILEAMKADLAGAGQVPVLLTGDFNASSHLDYTSATAAKHCGYASFPWPTSKLPEQAGLTDSFRKANPDPAAKPGDTWSPVYKKFTGGYGYDDHIGEPEPRDRIDYVHFAGKLTVQRSQALVAGDPKPYPDHEANEWTSDHAAVLTTFSAAR